MDKLLSMLGLAYKAGKIVFGTEGVVGAIRSRHKVPLVLLASDASDNTVKKITDGCRYYKVRLETAYVSKKEIGHILKGRSDVACVAVTNEGFAGAICDIISKQSTDSNHLAGGALTNDNQW